MKYRHTEPSEVPRPVLAFTETRRPVVFWNMTRQCNLSCSHCYLSAGPRAGVSSPQEELSTAEAKAFIVDLAAIKVPLLMFSGGEALLRPDFWELAAYAKECSLTTAMSTNGTLITPKIAGQILACGIEYVGVSLDGATAATHDAIRNKPGCFERAVQGLVFCRDAGIRTGIRITVTKENIHEVLSLIDLAVKLKIPRFCVYWLVPSGRGGGIYDRQITVDEASEVFDLLLRRAGELKDEGIEFLTVDAPQDGIRLLKKLEESGSEEYENAKKLLRCTGDSCSAGDRVANVDPSGNIYPCQFMQQEAFRIGSVREQKFSTIWAAAQNPVLMAFREKKNHLTGKCGACGHRETCGGGCRIRAYVQYGDIRADDPLCPFH
jgi:radical SAM protein with 4Fe4S-binding SPASM domain